MATAADHPRSKPTCERFGAVRAASRPVHRARLRPPCSSRTRNDGTPTAAAMTPTGSCTGATTVRATASASTTNAPPPSALAGSRTAAARAPISRSACGTTSPTKPIAPAVATAAPVASAAAASAMRRRRDDRDAERRRPGVAAGEPVELARGRPHERQRDQPGEPRDAPLGGAVQVAEKPEHHAAQLHLGGQHQQHRDERRAGRADHHADQQQRDRRLLRRREPAPAEQAPRQQEEHGRRGQRTGAGTDRDTPLRQQQRAAERAEPEHQQRADRRAAGQAEHVRIGERIAGQQLHQRAGQRQCGTGAEAREHARDADLPEDLGGRPTPPRRARRHADRSATTASASMMTQQFEASAGARSSEPEAVVADAEPALSTERRVVAHRFVATIEGVQQARLETPFDAKR